MKSIKPALFTLIVIAVSLPFVACGKGTVPVTVLPLTITTSSLPIAVVQRSYSATLVASGGQGPFTWSIISGTLPAGITMSSAGVFSGTPTTKTTSPASITVQVTDSQTPTAAVTSRGYSVTVNDALSITTKTVKNGAVSVPYSVTLVAAGGAPPYTWTLVSGSLPNGLTLASSGGISGTPTTEGTSSFTLQVADAENPAATVTQDYTLTIGGAVARLSGNYAFQFRGFKGNGIVLQAGSFVSDGAGNITSGVVDIVSSIGGSGVGHIMATITGTYTLETNGHGSMTLFFSAGYGSGNYEIASATSTSLTYFSFIQNGDGVNTTAGSGLIKAQDTIPADLSTFGNATGAPWAFGGYGADATNARYAAAGSFTLTYSTGNSSAAISNGLIDTNDNGTVKTGNSFTGTMNPPDATTGRGTANFSLSQSTGALAYYYVGASNGSLELITIDTDPSSLNSSSILYTFRKQNSLNGGYTNHAIAGPVISELSSIPAPKTPDVSLGLVDFDGNGTAYATLDENNAGTVTQDKFTATYAVDSTGRTTFTNWPGTVNPIMYLWSFNDGFLLGTDAAVTYGVMEFQNIQSNSHVPSNGDFTGAYSGGTIDPVVGSQTVEVDTDNADGAGNLTGTYDVSGGGNPPQQGLNLTATYNVDVNCLTVNTYGYTTCGRFPLLDSNQNQIGVGYLVNIFGPTRVVSLTTNTPQPVINAIQK